MKKDPGVSSAWLSPTTLVPVILALISLGGTVGGGLLNRKTAAELAISKDELAIMARDLGFAMNEDKQYKRAQTLLEIALRQNPKDGSIYYSLGYSFKMIGRQEAQTNRLKAKSYFEDALKHFQQALKLGVDNIPAEFIQWHMGSVLLELQRYDEAEENFLQAQRMYQQDWSFMAEAGRLYISKNDRAKALEFLNAASTLWANANPGQRNDYLANLLTQAQALKDLVAR